MHQYELLACVARISSVLVYVVLHPFLCGIYQEFGFGLAPFRLGIWIGPLAYAVISAMASSPYLWSCRDEKSPDCVMRLSDIVGV